MNTERDLATTRKASPGACNAARYVSAGFLSLVLRAHTGAGGEDPRECSRKQLLDMDAPIKCAKQEAPKNPGKRRKRVDLRNELVAEAKSEFGGRFPDRGSYREACGQSALTAQAAQLSDIISSVARPSRKRKSMSELDAEYNRKALSHLWGTSSRLQPFREDAALAAAGEFALRSRDNCEGGMQWGSMLSCPTPLL